MSVFCKIYFYQVYKHLLMHVTCFCPHKKIFFFLNCPFLIITLSLTADIVKMWLCSLCSFLCLHRVIDNVVIGKLDTFFEKFSVLCT